MNKTETITKEYLENNFATKEYLENNFATKEYLNRTLDEKTKNFVTNDSLDKKLNDTMNKHSNEIKQHMTDLRAGFREEIKGVCDQVTSLGEKITVIGDYVIKMDKKIDKISMDTFHIKSELRGKVSKKEHLALEKRVIHLEVKTP